MSDESGFRIGSVLYPFVERIRLTDPALVREVTGLEFQEFAEHVDEHGTRDPLVRAGLAAIAVWQANPRWSRERVRKFIEQIDMDALVIEVGEDDSDPPAEGAENAPNPSPEPSDESTRQPEPPAPDNTPG